MTYRQPGQVKSDKKALETAERIANLQMAIARMYEEVKEANDQKKPISHINYIFRKIELAEARIRKLNDEYQL